MLGKQWMVDHKGMKLLQLRPFHLKIRKMGNRPNRLLDLTGLHLRFLLRMRYPICLTGVGVEHVLLEGEEPFTQGSNPGVNSASCEYGLSVLQ